MNRLFSILFCATLIILSLHSFSQNFILLEKNGGKKKLEIHLGNQLKCTCSNNEEYQGIVIEITDSTILLNNNTLIYADEIIEVNYPRKFFLGMTDLGLKVAVGYVGVSVINRALAGMKIFPQSTFIIAGTSLGVAGISYLASIRHCKIEKGKWKIKLITYVQEEDL